MRISENGPTRSFVPRPRLVIAITALIALMAACAENATEPDADPTAGAASTAPSETASDSNELELVTPSDLPDHEGETVRVQAYAILIDGEWRLCPFLNESLPPSCEGPGPRLEGFPRQGSAVETSQGVSWTSYPVTLTGTFNSSTETFEVRDLDAEQTDSPVLDDGEASARIGVVSVEGDGQRLVVDLDICERPLLRLKVDETPDAVRLHAITTDAEDLADCAKGAEVHLDAPLGDRTVIDVSSGEELPVRGRSGS